jgi:predicted HTH domain antitoxin
MQIKIDLPDHLQLTEADLRQELAIALFQQERITLGSASQPECTKLNFNG